MDASKKHFEIPFVDISLDENFRRDAPKLSATDIDNACFDGAAPSQNKNYSAKKKSNFERVKWSKKLDFILSAVGYAVGFGNVWRFPYLCFSNGGGAFLIPYFVMMTLVGLPLFYLELALGQFASLGPIAMWKVCPIFTGLGYTMVGLNLLVSIYYNVILALSIFYLFASFSSPLPWAMCGNSWNKHCLSIVEKEFNHYNVTVIAAEDAAASEYLTPALNDNSITYNFLDNTSNNSTLCSSCSIESSVTITLAGMTNVSAKSPAEEFWLYYVLGMDVNNTNIAHIGEVRWQLILCNLVAWTIVLLCIIKGIKSSGKVVYFTATFPYLVLVILFVRGVSLPGALEGIKFYIIPDFSKMTSVQVWNDAAIQILFSLGPGFGGLIMLGSYNKFNNRCNRDAILITLINCFTSVFAGFVIFSVLGFMSYKRGVKVAEVIDKGPGLAFIAYPEALSMMPGAPFWSISFFFMLFTLGLDSQFVGVESIITGLMDIFPVVTKWKKTFTVALCFILFLTGIPCITQGGMFVIELMDQFTTSFPLLVVVLLEAITIGWIYGIRQFSKDVQLMLGTKPNYYWLSCWMVATPAIITFIFVFKCVEYQGLYYGIYRYPNWAEGIGWALVSVLIGPIPLIAVYKFFQCVGSLQKFWWVLTFAAPLNIWKLHHLWSPASDWRPANNREDKTENPGLQAGISDENDRVLDDRCMENRRISLSVIPHENSQNYQRAPTLSAGNTSSEDASFKVTFRDGEVHVFNARLSDGPQTNFEKV